MADKTAFDLVVPWVELLACLGAVLLAAYLAVKMVASLALVRADSMVLK